MDEQTKPRKPLVRLTGLWESKARDGGFMLSGNLGGARILVVRNTRKREGSKDPDFNVLVTEPDRPASAARGDDGGREPGE